jgi:hypothetical protein
LFVDARTHGGIALRVHIGQQNALADVRQGGRQIDTGGSLADATFLVCDAKNLRQADSPENGCFT